MLLNELPTRWLPNCPISIPPRTQGRQSFAYRDSYSSCAMSFFQVPGPEGQGRNTTARTRGKRTSKWTSCHKLVPAHQHHRHKLSVNFFFPSGSHLVAKMTRHLFTPMSAKIYSFFIFPSHMVYCPQFLPRFYRYCLLFLIYYAHLYMFCCSWSTMLICICFVVPDLLCSLVQVLLFLHSPY